MQSFFVLAILGLGFLVTFQIAKASEYVAVLRGEAKAQKQTNKVNGFLLLAFLILGLIGVFYCNERLKGKILGVSASEQGVHIDTMMWITLAITGVVFLITQIALFWFAYKYQASDDRKAYFYPHNNKLEVIWTVIPAIALSVLVTFGLIYWFKVTGDAPKDAMIVEVTGKQFGWEFRYPGKDGILGKKFYKKIDAAKNNPLGQLWEDPNNHDDIWMEQEMHLVVNKPVKFVIGSKDVIHDVGLIHFRMKMDAVPGTPTTMWFTPRFTTKEMMKRENNPKFVYEITCDQMCGRGHTTMRGVIVVETQEEFDRWLYSHKPQYYVANPDKDPTLKLTADTTHNGNAGIVPVSGLTKTKK
ncbi:MAG TPA: cytochrome c oxidase subunit II [Chitinophagaceae bacterium]|nr:cytochrome c oxidase subunit II [Chitinophagaceae bacterium]